MRFIHFARSAGKANVQMRSFIIQQRNNKSGSSQQLRDDGGVEAVVGAATLVPHIVFQNVRSRVGRPINFMPLLFMRDVSVEVHKVGQ